MRVSMLAFLGIQCGALWTAVAGRADDLPPLGQSVAAFAPALEVGEYHFQVVLDYQEHKIPQIKETIVTDPWGFPVIRPTIEYQVIKVPVKRIVWLTVEAKPVVPGPALPAAPAVPATGLAPAAEAGIAAPATNAAPAPVAQAGAVPM